jgi:hypothetical protein
MLRTQLNTLATLLRCTSSKIPEQSDGFSCEEKSAAAKRERFAQESP